MSQQANEGGAPGVNNGGGAGGGGGGSATPWYGELPAERADLREWVTNKGFKDPLSALDSSFNLEKLVGFEKAGRTVVLPKDDQDAEGMKAFRTKLGVPETAEAYELPMRELQQGEQHDESEKKFAAILAQGLHGANVPKGAAHSLVKSLNEFLVNEQKAEREVAQTRAKTELAALKTEWGDKFEPNAELARHFLKESGWDDAKVSRYEEAVGTAEMLRDFYKWGSATSEHPFVAAEGSGPIGMTLSSAKAKLDELRAARAGGTITDAQWKDGKEAEFTRLSQFVAEKSAA